MSRKRFIPKQIIEILPEAEMNVSQGRRVEQLHRELCMTQQTCSPAQLKQIFLYGKKSRKTLNHFIKVQGLGFCSTAGFVWE